ncbi:hypothetical protein AB9T88_12715, partial [Flavobacterium sp. LBUM151]
PLKQYETFTEISYDGKTVEKKAINISANDTLYVKFRYNDYFAKDLNNYHREFEFVQDSANNQLIYSNDVRLHVLHTDEGNAYLQIEKSARGNSFTNAKKRAEKINYKIEINGNHLILDNYFLTDIKNKFRGQEVDIYLYLPEGQLFKPDTSVQDYDDSDDDFFNLHFSGNYNYKVEGSKIKCLNCPKDEDEYNDTEDYDSDENTIDNDTVKEVSIKINGKEVLNGKKTKGKLTTDKNGVIIKIN